MDWLKTTDFAHRGLHGLGEQCPENSMPAIEEAVYHGYGIEIDIQRSADNEAMVFHDLSLKRLTGKQGLVANWQSHKLKKTRLRGSKATIATLKEVLDFVQGEVPLLLEIKSAPGIPGLLEMRVAELVKRYRGPVGLMSMALASVEALALLAPRVPCGEVVSKLARRRASGGNRWLRQMPRPALAMPSSNGRRFVACEFESLLAEQPPRWIKNGRPLLTWTVTSSEQATQARELADSIIFEGFRP